MRGQPVAVEDERGAGRPGIRELLDRRTSWPRMPLCETSARGRSPAENEARDVAHARVRDELRRGLDQRDRRRGTSRLERSLRWSRSSIWAGRCVVRSSWKRDAGPRGRPRRPTARGPSPSTTRIATPSRVAGTSTCRRTCLRPASAPRGPRRAAPRLRRCPGAEGACSTRRGWPCRRCGSSRCRTRTMRARMAPRPVPALPADE